MQQRKGSLIAAVVAIALMQAVAASAAEAAEPAGAAGSPGAAGPFLTEPKEVPYAVPPVSEEKVDLDVRVSREEAIERVNPVAVEAFASEYRVDEKTARERLATQGMVPDVAAVLRLLLGSGYTDTWWDNEAGQLVVLATKPATDAEIAEALTERGLTTDEFRVERVGYGQEELLAAGQEVTGQLEPLFEARQFTTALSGGRVRVTIASTSDARQRERATAISARVSRANDAVPVDVTVAEQETIGADPPVTCNSGSKFCDEIIAGSYYQVTGGGCTFAFPVYWVGRSPFVPSILTAAHCVNHLPTVSNVQTCRAAGVYNGCLTNVGLTLQYFYGYGRSDWAMIDLYAPGFFIFGGWYNWGPGGATQITSRDWYPPPRGTWVCKNGATSGSSCGQVEAYGAWVNQSGVPGGEPRIVNLIETHNLRFCKGDSGGPVTSASVPSAIGNVAQVAAYDESSTCSLAVQYAGPWWEPEYYFNIYFLSGLYNPTA